MKGAPLLSKSNKERYSIMYSIKAETLQKCFPYIYYCDADIITHLLSYQTPFYCIEFDGQRVNGYILDDETVLVNTLIPFGKKIPNETLLPLEKVVEELEGKLGCNREEFFCTLSNKFFYNLAKELKSPQLYYYKIPAESYVTMFNQQTEDKIVSIEKYKEWVLTMFFCDSTVFIQAVNKSCVEYYEVPLKEYSQFVKCFEELNWKD